MKTPTLEEVKEYFKDADKIQSLMGRKFKNDGKFRGSKYAMDGDTSIYAKNGKYEVWNQLRGYAKILSYKEPKEKTYKITREQIKEVYGYCNSTELQNTVKRWFPEVFETKLTVGKWYKKTWKDGDIDLFPVYEIVQNGNILDKGNYFRNRELLNKADSYGNISCLTDSRVVITEATEQEVTEALIKEAVKRGFKEGVYGNNSLVRDDKFKDYLLEKGYFEYLNDTLYWSLGDEKETRRPIFFKGQWAEIIPTLTKQEAEAKLNCKII